jgi:hypothetical protein
VLQRVHSGGSTSQVPEGRPRAKVLSRDHRGVKDDHRCIGGGSIIELTPTEAFTLFKKVVDNDTWASSGRLLSVQPMGNVKGVLQVEKENILEGKIDSLMRRLEMEVERKRLKI